MVEPGLIIAITLNPIRVIPTYSSALNLKAIPAIRGAARERIITLINPPSAEETVEIPIASPARPCWQSGYPSKLVAMAEGVPGILIKIAEIDPPYTAPVYKPSKKANETTGSIPKVKGINTAIVIVAVRPGNAPKTIPIRTPRKELKKRNGFVKKARPSRYRSNDIQSSIKLIIRLEKGFAEPL
jgi:hypothetical protein